MQSKATANPNPNIFGFFLDRKHSQLNDGVDCGWLTEETLKSDTKMIWGCPIFSVSEVDGDEHTMNTAEIHDDKWMITCMTLTSLSIDPCRQCNSSQPCKIFATPHTCARSRRPRSGKLQSSNPQWNSRSHKLSVA